MKKIVLVGEMNPYGSDPRYALFCKPDRSAGGRLQRLILEMSPADYLRDTIRYNLCEGKWSIVKAREEASRIKSHHSEDVIVILGRAVAGAFGLSDCKPFSVNGNFVIIPHPSGRCLTWNEEGAFKRARDLIQSAIQGER